MVTVYVGGGGACRILSRCLARSSGSMISIRYGLYYFFPKKNSTFLFLLVPPAGTNISFKGCIIFNFYDAEFWGKEGSVNVKVDVARGGRLGICN